VTPASGVGVPGGSVTFTIDSPGDRVTVPLQVKVGRAYATLSENQLAPGTHTIGAHYDGDAAFAPGSSTTSLALQVSAAPTAVTLTASARAVVFDQPLTFTAVVVATRGSGIPTGAVYFDGFGGSYLSRDSGGQSVATLGIPWDDATVGSIPIGAYYGGDGGFAPSDSTSIIETIVPAPVQLHVTVPTGPYTGMPQPAIVTVTGIDWVYATQNGNTIASLGTQTGPTLAGVAPTVTYYVGASPDGPLLAITPVFPGTYTLVVVFPGSPRNAPASALATFTITPGHAGPHLGSARRHHLGNSADGRARASPRSRSASTRRSTPRQRPGRGSTSSVMLRRSTARPGSPGASSSGAWSTIHRPTRSRSGSPILTREWFAS
jgi:hypothetical protein